MDRQLLQGSAKSRTGLKKGWLEGTVVDEQRPTSHKCSPSRTEKSCCSHVVELGREPMPFGYKLSQ